MRVIIDGDGVLLRYTEPLFAALEITEYTLEDVTEWDIFGLVHRWFGADAHEEAVALNDTASFWESQTFLEGAEESVAFIRARCDELICVTHPWEGCATWREIRTAHLAKLGFKPSEIFFNGDKRGYAGDLFIDDKPSHITDWAAANPSGRAAIFDQPYNRPPAFNWPERVCWRPGHAELGRLLSPR